MPAAATSTPRKTRTRKPKASAKVAKYQPKAPIVEDVQVAQPKVDLISREQYIADAKARWSIHQYEIQELWKDLQVVGKWIVTHSKSAYEYTKKSYDRAFNQTT